MAPLPCTAVRAASTGAVRPLQLDGALPPASGATPPGLQACRGRLTAAPGATMAPHEAESAGWASAAAAERALGEPQPPQRAPPMDVADAGPPSRARFGDAISRASSASVAAGVVVDARGLSMVRRRASACTMARCSPASGSSRERRRPFSSSVRSSATAVAELALLTARSFCKVSASSSRRSLVT